MCFYFPCSTFCYKPSTPQKLLKSPYTSFPVFPENPGSDIPFSILLYCAFISLPFFHPSTLSCLSCKSWFRHPFSHSDRLCFYFPSILPPFHSSILPPFHPILSFLKIRLFPSTLSCLSCKSWFRHPFFHSVRLCFYFPSILPPFHSSTLPPYPVFPENPGSDGCVKFCHLRKRITNPLLQRSNMSIEKGLSMGSTPAECYVHKWTRNDFTT